MRDQTDRLAQALNEASVYGIGATSDTNQRVILDAAKALAAQSSADSEQTSFQKRVHGWMMDCFSMEICRDRQERNHRFLEEALELVQACGCTASEAHQLVDYVYGRDQGDINQEVGGVMVTLAALCLANDIDMHQGGEIELARILQPAIMNKIRAKQAAKPKHSPLPAHPAPGAGAEPQAAPTRDAVIEECAKVLDDAAQDWNRIRDPGMANNARSYARKVRALKSQQCQAESVQQESPKPAMTAACQRCDGDGYVRRDANLPDVKCPACNGWGYTTLTRPERKP